MDSVLQISLKYCHSVQPATHNDLQDVQVDSIERFHQPVDLAPPPPPPPAASKASGGLLSYLLFTVYGLLLYD